MAFDPFESDEVKKINLFGQNNNTGNSNGGFDPFDPKNQNNDDDNVLQVLYHNLASATGDTIHTTNDALARMNKPANMSEEDWRAALPGLSKNISQFGENLEDEHKRTYSDPFGWRNILGGVVGVVPYGVALGVGTAAAMRSGNAQMLGQEAAQAARMAGIFGRYTPQVAKAAEILAPAATIDVARTIPEAGLEWQGAYDGFIDDAKKDGSYVKGETESKAEQVANGVFKDNIGLLSGTNLLETLAIVAKLPTVPYKSAALKILGTSLSNAGEEAAQQIFPKAEADKPWSLNDEDVKLSALIGGISGGAPVVAGMAYDKYYPKKKDKGEVATGDNNGFDRFNSNDNSNDDSDDNSAGGGSGGYEAFKNSIVSQESGGNYDAKGEVQDDGDYAIGKYQIMKSNWAQWAQDAGLDADAEPTPENQEIVADAKLKPLYEKYGARNAAIAWYGGEGAIDYSEETKNRKQGNAPSINEYADSVVGRMGGASQSEINGAPSYADVSMDDKSYQDIKAKLIDFSEGLDVKDGKNIDLFNDIQDTVERGDKNEIFKKAQQVGIFPTQEAKTETGTNTQTEEEAQPQANVEGNNGIGKTIENVRNERQQYQQIGLKEPQIQGLTPGVNVAAKPSTPALARLASKAKAIATRPTGATVQVKAGEGANTTEFDTQYKLVDASDLTISNDPHDYKPNKLYPQELQPRTRDSAAMRAQVENIAGNMRPADLTASRDINNGAPLINADGVVENGNGRTMAIIKALKATANEGKRKANGEAYKQYLMDNAEQFGFTKEQVAAMKSPVLVRQRMGDVDVNKVIASTAGGAVMSASEQANADAKALSTTTLKQYQENDNGDLTTAANLQFVGSALKDVTGNDANQLNALATADGKVSQQGIARVRNALFAKAYKDNGLLALMSESTDNNIRTITNAMINAAPYLADIQAKMENGALHNYDLTSDLAAACKKLMALRNEGKPVSLYLQEGSMFGEEISITAKQILQYLDENKKSAKKNRDMLLRVGELVEQQGDPKQIKLLAGEENISLDSLYKSAMGDVEGASLFEKNQNINENSEPGQNQKSNAEVTDNGSMGEVNTGNTTAPAETAVQANQSEQVSVQKSKVKTSKKAKAEEPVKPQQERHNYTAEETQKVFEDKGYKIGDGIAVSYADSPTGNISYGTIVRFENNRAIYKEYYNSKYDGTEPYKISNDGDFYIYTNRIEGKNPEVILKHSDNAKIAEAITAGEEKKKSTNKPVEAKHDKSDFGNRDEAVNELSALIGKKTVKQQQIEKAETLQHNAVLEESAAQFEDNLDDLLKEMHSELNNLSANPVFNPKIYELGFKIGIVLVKRGAKNFTAWKQQMVDTIKDEKIKPWLESIWTGIRSYPQDTPLNEQRFRAFVKYVGTNYDKNINSVYATFEKDFGKDTLEEFKPLVNSAWEATNAYFNPKLDVAEAATEVKEEPKAEPVKEEKLSELDQTVKDVIYANTKDKKIANELFDIYQANAMDHWYDGNNIAKENRIKKALYSIMSEEDLTSDSSTETNKLFSLIKNAVNNVKPQTKTNLYNVGSKVAWTSKDGKDYTGTVVSDQDESDTDIKVMVDQGEGSGIIGLIKKISYLELSNKSLHKLNTEEAKPQVAETKPDDVGATFNLNKEHQGIEIKFNGKPDASVITNLKANGFRWSPRNKNWYAKQSNSKAMKFAESIGFKPEKVVQLGQEDSTAKVGANNDQANGARNEGQAGNNAGSTSAQSTIRSAANSNASRNNSDKGTVGNVEGTSPKNDGVLQEVGSIEGLRNDETSGRRPGVSEKPASGNVLDGRKGTGEPISNGVVGAGGRGRTDRNDTSTNAEGKPLPVSRPNGRGSQGDSVGNPASTATILNGNYHIDDPNALIGGTPKVRFSRNKLAIETIKSIMDEGRQATAEEKDILASYIGWGSFGQELFQGNWANPQPKTGWEKEDAWLRETLDKKEWESVQNSIINAHFTEPTTVQRMWEMIRRMGFTGGRVLEPSMGVGNFFGLMPKDLMEKSNLNGIELDTVTGNMAKVLYPGANIQIKGYQESKVPDNFYDLIIGNVPFANFSPSDSRYNRFKANLHDYFFLKGLDELRPGGLMVAITSKGTMDKVDRQVRIELAKKAELVAAYRLPAGAFDKYAGTSVVTDILVFQKREQPLMQGVLELPWVNTTEHFGGYYKNEAVNYHVNNYFEENPDNVLGKIGFGHGTTTGKPGMIVEKQDDFADRLDEIPASVPLDIYKAAKYDKNIIHYADDDSMERQNSVNLGEDGKLYVKLGDKKAPLNEIKKYEIKSAKDTAARTAEIKDLIGVRKALDQLMDAERSDVDAKELEGYRKQLNKVYDDFVKKHGKLRECWSLQKYFKGLHEVNYATLSALETDNGGKTTIFKESTMRVARKVQEATVTDAFVVMRNTSHDLDLELVANLSKKTTAEVTKELLGEGTIYKTPGGNYEFSDIYLAGNVRQKLKEAEEALSAGDQEMQHSINALKKVVPRDVPYFNIEANIGATWISHDTYCDFIAHLLNFKGDTKEAIGLAEKAGAWKINVSKELSHTARATDVFGTSAIAFNKLLRHVFNHTKPTIKTKDKDGVMVIDQEETDKALEKIEKITDEFESWLWASQDRKAALVKQYNDVNNCMANPVYDGSFLDMVGMALKRGKDEFSLRKHQVNAIYRGLVNGNGIFAHEVGTGKTYTMAGVAIESRRYGLAKKPLLLAHNANSAAVASEINDMYPGAKVLYIDNLDKKTLALKMQQIKLDDWDVIVMPHSQIENLTLSEATMFNMAAEQIAELEDAAIEAAAEDTNSQRITVEDMDSLLNEGAKDKKAKMIMSSTAKKLVLQRNKIIENIKKMADKSSKEGAISFEDLGIDMIIVDEAHSFKKPPFTTKMSMKGLNASNNGKSIQLQFLTQYTQEKNNGRGVFVFTGTPITNTLVEMYHQMRYVMSKEMKLAGVYDFDSWFKVFAAEVSDVELTSTGEYEAVSRLSAFTNVAELRRMAGQYLDIVFGEDMPEFVDRATKSGKTLKDADLTEDERNELLYGRTEKPQGRPYKKIVNETVPLSKAQDGILKHLKSLAKKFKNASKKEKKEYMKKGDPCSPIIVETNSSNAGMDARLYDMSLDSFANEADSKEAHCVKNVISIYNEHPLTTQVIFMDRGLSDTKDVSDGKDELTGKKLSHKEPCFNLAKDIVKQLVAKGIPREEIVIMESSFKADKREKIAKLMNESKVRVVIGSSEVLGVGVNMQENLRAMHMMDAPYMPGVLEQRVGRGWRQGNKWNTVLEIRYISEQLDAKRWQILMIKDKFIKMFLHADENVRTIEGDAVGMSESDDEAAGDYEETLAKATGDPRILFKTKYQNNIKKLEKKFNIFRGGIEESKIKIGSLQKNNAKLKTQIEKMQKDEQLFQEYDDENFKIELVGSLDYKHEKSIAFTDKTKANEHLQTILPQLMGLNNSDKLGTFAGFDLFVTKFEDYDGQRKFSIDVIGEASRDTRGVSPTVRMIYNALAKNSKEIEATQKKVVANEEDINAMAETLAQGFPHAERLAKLKKDLDTLEKDLIENPVPAPGWLIQGSPVDTDIYVDGKRYVVTGHKATTEGYYVVGVDFENQNSDAKIFPFQDAKDSFGMELYDTDKHEPSPVYKAPEVKAETGKKASKVEKAADEENDEEYSIADNAGQKRTSADNAGQQIKEAFPAAKNITQVSEGAFVADMPNGSKLYVNVVDEIVLTQEQYEKAKKDYGGELPANYFVEGSAKTVGKDGIITLVSKAGDGAIDHEALHVAEKLALTPKEIAAIAKKYPSAEERAEAYRTWKQARANGKGGLLGKLWQKVHDFAKQVEAFFGKENAQNVFRKVESGEVWNRESDNAPDVTDIQFSIKAAQQNLFGKLNKEKKEPGSITIEKNKPKDALGLWGNLGASPSQLAKTMPVVKKFFDWATNAMQTQEKLRSYFNRKYNSIMDGVKSKDERQQLHDLLIEGDAISKEWTKQELLDDGVSDNVAEAYRRIRGLMKKAYNLLNDTRKRVQTHTQNMSSEKLEDMLHSNKFIEVLDKTPTEEGLLVRWKEPATWTHVYEGVDENALELMKKNDAVQVLTADKAGTDIDGNQLYDVKTRERMTDLTNNEGYIPHFFHDYIVYERTENEDGTFNYDAVASGNNIKEATKLAEGYLKDNPNAQLFIRAKQFEFDGEANQAVNIGDKAYSKMIKSIAEHNTFTIEEAKELVNGSLTHGKGKHRFFGNFLERKGAKGYEKDMDWVLRHFFNSTARYVALENDFKPQSRSLFERLYGSFDKEYDGVAKYIKDFINDINGNPSALEKLINDKLNSNETWQKHFTSRFGERAALSAVNSITGTVSVLKLGVLNASSALLNFSQLVNAAGLIGDISAVVNGARRLSHGISMQDKKVLVESGVLNDIGLDSGAGYGKLSVGKLGSKSMILFKKSEAFCRRSTILAAYHKAIARGMSHAQAIEYAKDVNRRANFDYGINDSPNSFRRMSIIGQLVLQFKKYPIKELELMSDMLSSRTNAKQKAIFWGGYFLLSGLMQVPVVDLFNDLWEWLFGKNPKTAIKDVMFTFAGDNPQLKALTKWAVYGLGSAANVDFSSRTGIADVVPTSLLEMSGPVINTVLSTAKNIIRGDMGKALTSVSPGMGNIAQAIAGESNKTNGRTNTVYDTAYDRVLRAMGFKSVDEAITTDMKAIVSQRKNEKKNARQQAVDNYLKEPTSENVGELRKLGITPKQVNEERKKKSQTGLQRTEESVSKKERRSYKDLYDFAK